MNIYPLSIESIKEKAEATLSQIEILQTLSELEIPGKFTFSPPTNNRLAVDNVSDLHEARTILRKHFGWRDHITTKFFSCGEVIVVYAPDDDVLLPIPFEIWVQAPPERFPLELLGGCKLVQVGSEINYNIICPVEVDNA